MEPINDIENLQTPCFVLDSDELMRSINGFKNALRSHFSKSIIAYSVKTNSLSAGLKLINNADAYAEVVSHDEYELALLCGFSKEHIVYNGPLKSKETFLDAIQNGAIVNIDSKRELDWLKELPLERTYKIGIRLNVNISNISPEDAICEGDNSRFGFSDETAEFSDAILRIKQIPNVKLAGIHIHRTSSNRSIHFYKNLLEYTYSVIEKYGLQLEYVDIGGGYYGVFPGAPTYEAYCYAFYEVLSAHGLQDLCIIIEPGNALVASCFTFISEVIDVKQVEEDLWFITTDGSRNDIDPFFKKDKYLTNIKYQSCHRTVKKQIIAGCTCLENDRMFTLSDKPLLGIGDKILYRNVGAYTMSLSPMFIRYIPNIYMKSSNGYVLVRGKWSSKDLIIKDL